MHWQITKNKSGLQEILNNWNYILRYNFEKNNVDILLFNFFYPNILKWVFKFDVGILDLEWCRTLKFYEK